MSSSLNAEEELEDIARSINSENHLQFFGALVGITDTGIVGAAAITGALLIIGPIAILGGVVVYTLGRKLLYGIKTYGAEKIALKLVEIKLASGVNKESIILSFNNSLIPSRIKRVVQKYLDGTL